MILRAGSRQARYAFCSVCCGLSLFYGAATPAAEIDTVTRTRGAKPVMGEITSVSKTEVVVTQKVGNKEERIPASEIERVEWKAEPPALSLARSNEAAGNIPEALNGFQEALKASGPPALGAEIEFLIARAHSILARRDSAEAGAAKEKLLAFVNSHRDHFRFYPAQQLLAEVCLLSEDWSEADAAYGRLQQAPWLEVQMLGKSGTARVMLAQGKVAAAAKAFEEVAGMPAASPGERENLLDAQLGQAECLQKLNKTEDAKRILDKIIREAPAEATRLLARSYLLLGDGYAAQPDRQADAVLAYLHLDVLPTLAKHSDLHAAALYQLSQLWPALGKAPRGAEAAAKLEESYPNSVWAKKLAGGG